MNKKENTYYFVQFLNADGKPETVYHTHEIFEDNFKYKVDTYEQAMNIIESRNELNPTWKHRIVKVVEEFDDVWI